MEVIQRGTPDIMSSQQPEEIGGNCNRYSPEIRDHHDGDESKECGCE